MQTILFNNKKEIHLLLWHQANIILSFITEFVLINLWWRIPLNIYYYSMEPYLWVTAKTIVQNKPQLNRWVQSSPIRLWGTINALSFWLFATSFCSTANLSSIEQRFKFLQGVICQTQSEPSWRWKACYANVKLSIGYFSLRRILIFQVIIHRKFP